MSKADIYEDKVISLLDPIIADTGIKMIDVEFTKEAGNYYLRVYLDKEGGINIDDCETVSRALSDKLDETDPIPEAYILEVSSPGLDRPLRRERDFAASIGRQIDIKLYKEEDGCKAFRGILKAYDKDSVTVDLGESEKTFERKALADIRWAYDLEL